MRKSTVITWLCLIAMLCGLLSACGSTETGNNVVGTEISNVTEETKNAETTSIYEEGTDVFLISNNVYGQDCVDGNSINMNSLNPKGGKVVTESEILIYNQRKENIGYVKSGVTMTLASQSDEWTYVYVTDGGFIVRTEDLKDLQVLIGNQVNVENNEDVEEETEKEVVDTTPSNNDGNTNENENNSSGEYIPPINDDVVIEEPTPEPTYTYTADEVISIVRSTLENGGMVWSIDYATSKGLTDFRPDLGMGWGIVNISMTDPYTDAQLLLDGYLWDKNDLYYLEYQGTENGTVVLKAYWGNQW